MEDLPPFFRDTRLNLHLRTYYFNQTNTDGSAQEAPQATEVRLIQLGKDDPERGHLQHITGLPASRGDRHRKEMSRDGAI